MILRAQEIHKRFGPRRVLQGATLGLEAGEVVLLTGANGSGKTTLAQILATVLRPDRGDVLYDGTPVASRLRAARRGLGFATHRPLLYLGLSPVENLSFFGRLAGIGDAPARALGMLERFGLRSFADTPIERFSRGMLQRITLIRALLPEPRLLILDEPYAGLDDDGTSTLNAYLTEARARGAATLLVSHDRARVAPVLTRALALRAGRIEASA